MRLKGLNVITISILATVYQHQNIDTSAVALTQLIT